MEGERPRVFQPGTMTVVVGNDGLFSVFAGATLISMARGVDLGTKKVSMRSPDTDEERRTLDEEVRAVRAAGFENM